MRCKIVCIQDDDKEVDDKKIDDEDLISFKDISGCQCTMLKKDGKGLISEDGKDFKF